MARPSISINIDGATLRSLLLAKRGKLEDVADDLNLSRQTLHAWFSNNKIPPRQLSQIAQKYTLNVQDIRRLKKTEEFLLFFRTLRNVAVPEETKEAVRSLAKDFFLLHSREIQIKASISSTLSTSDPVEMASHVRRLLVLPEHGTTTEQLIASLDGFNLPVLFVAFDQSLKEAKIHAFTAIKGTTRAIFLDRDCAWEDVSWRIIHELAHILAGHQGEVTAGDEKFCNQVAIEILTPKSFFTSKKDVLKKAILGASIGALRPIVAEVSDFLGASYMGVVLALIDNRIIAKDSNESRSLFKIAHQNSGARILISTITTPTRDKEESFWDAALEDPSKRAFFKFELLARDALIGGNISISRASEIFSVDVLQMEQLRRLWIDQYATTD